jgi:hypothetical protein
LARRSASTSLHHRLGRAPRVFDRDTRETLLEHGRKLLLVLLLDGAAKHDLALGLGGLVELVERRDRGLRCGELGNR